MFRSLGVLCGIATMAAGVVLAQPPASRPIDPEDGSATAVLKDPGGTQVGTAVLREAPHGLLLTVDLVGIPAGIHAFHMHEHGRCEPPTFESAGDHFAPHRNQHGFLNQAGPHAGDLPNIHVPESSRLSFELIADEVTLGPGDGSLLDADGASLVVHADPDDYQTQPAGAAGKRIACGQIMR